MATQGPCQCLQHLRNPRAQEKARHHQETHTVRPPVMSTRSLELRPALPMAIPSARARAARAARAPCAQPRSRDLPRRRLQGPKVARSIPSVKRDRWSRASNPAVEEEKPMAESLLRRSGRKHNSYQIWRWGILYAHRWKIAWATATAPWSSTWTTMSLVIFIAPPAGPSLPTRMSRWTPFLMKAKEEFLVLAEAVSTTW
mmetsp:Transcript_43501/g.94506  ORF Transcript_43501/g.94506 Transcript_43501/m.94506 type:complete len:200 (+) Transcript_43501:781-1380(+)